MDTHALLSMLVSGRRLDAHESEDLFSRLLAGELDEAQIGAVLALLQARPIGVDELCGAARVMRRHVTRVKAPRGERLIDTCGTGGGPKVFNVSTLAAIVAAGAGGREGRERVFVAKHGNRSRTGRGSAEVLLGLGVRVDASPEVQSQCLEEAGVCFCFAIHHHPAMKHAAGPRRSLGMRTIFNLLGPLTNPAGAQRQLIGVYAADLVETMAQSLAQLGAERAMVVHGLDGLDELSTSSPTLVAHVESGRVRVEEVDAQSLGLASASHESLSVDGLEAAVAAAREILDAQRGPRRDLTVLNAAAALVVADVCPSLSEGIKAAEESIDSGSARKVLETLVKVSQRSATP
ncbi:MAG: anthranilate phosphoribosyltransferase [Phycisphaeraceae bacterium]|nr:anthranilate phosphoribosyltransferase [Phycisphaeraceae bacterium]MCW5762823.1 anthranilate phosphoribosyltransferase [Phycisphaeraceae bacterium]